MLQHNIIVLFLTNKCISNIKKHYLEKRSVVITALRLSLNQASTGRKFFLPCLYPNEKKRKLGRESFFENRNLYTITILQYKIGNFMYLFIL